MIRSHKLIPFKMLKHQINYHYLFFQPSNDSDKDEAGKKRRSNGYKSHGRSKSRNRTVEHHENTTVKKNHDRHKAKAY